MAVTVCLTGYSLLAQSFEKGNKIINSGIKISIYKVSNSDDQNDDDDGAASYTIPLGFEYALSDRIGLGAEVGICNYFTGEDTITGTIAEANSFDLLINGNFHWVRGGRVDLYSGVGLGFLLLNMKVMIQRKAGLNQKALISG